MNELYNTLYDWQKKIVDDNLYRDRYGLYLDMGLGKTLVSLAFAEQKQADIILIVTLKSKVDEDINEKGSWEYWANKGGWRVVRPDDKNINYDGKTILLTNYEGLVKKVKGETKVIPIKPYIKDFIKNCKHKKVAIILDESHKIKSTKALCSKGINFIMSQLKVRGINPFVYLLSGTPFTNGYLDLYNQLKLLGCDMNKGDYEEKFCVRGNVGGLAGYQQPIVGYKNLKELYKLVHQYALTIKSSEVIDLPEQVFNDIEYSSKYYFDLFTKEMIDANIVNKELIKRGEKPLILKDKKVKNVFYRNLDYPSMDYLCETISSFWMRCRQLSIGFIGKAESYIWFDRSRLNRVKKLLSENESNYVLFYNYTPELFELYKICEELGYNIDVYSGDIKSLTFYNKYSEMSEEEKLTNNKNIILANFGSGSTGKNWQEYDRCIIFSLPTFDDYEQALKRVHRIGQNNTVIYYTFLNDNWLDRDMMKSLKEKIQYDENLFEKSLNDS